MMLKLLPPLILLLGLVAGVYLIDQRTNILPFAHDQNTDFDVSPPPVISSDPSYEILLNDLLTYFNISFDQEFSYDYLYWARDVLSGPYGDRIIELASPNGLINVSIANPGINEQVSCDEIKIRNRSLATEKPYNENLFKIVLVHELAHIIEQCNPGVKDGLQQIINKEGFLTNFSRYTHICVPGNINLNEDFAETLTYFINPEIAEQSLGIGSLCEPFKPAKNPYDSGKKPLHFQFAKDLLEEN